MTDLHAQALREREGYAADKAATLALVRQHRDSDLLIRVLGLDDAPINLSADFKHVRKNEARAKSRVRRKA